MRRDVVVGALLLLSGSALASTQPVDPSQGICLVGCWLCGSAAVGGAHAVEKNLGGPSSSEEYPPTSPAASPGASPAAVARVPDADYVPTGKGPVPLQADDGWSVIEAGQRWRVVTREGKTIEGVVTAVSTRGLAIDGTVVLATDIASLRRG